MFDCCHDAQDIWLFRLRSLLSTSKLECFILLCPLRHQIEHNKKFPDPDVYKKYIPIIIIPASLENAVSNMEVSSNPAEHIMADFQLVL